MEIYLNRKHHEEYKSVCIANPDPSTESCDWATFDFEQQKYYDVNFKKQKKATIYKCYKHGIVINSLRDRDSIKLHPSESWAERPLNHTLPNYLHDQDLLVVIMITEKQYPNPRVFTHITLDLIIDLFSNLLETPDVTFWHKVYCNNYAKLAYNHYEKQESLDRLKVEARSVFMDLSTFRRIFIRFFDKYLSKLIPMARDIILQHDVTEISVDGHQKLVKLLKLQDERLKLECEASLNIATLGGLGFILNWELYPGRGETQERMSELIVKPLVRSYELCKSPRSLGLGVGIDNVIKDYTLPNVLVPMIKQRAGCENSNQFITETGAELDLSTLFVIVKFTDHEHPYIYIYIYIIPMPCYSLTHLLYNVANPRNYTFHALN